MAITLAAGAQSGNLAGSSSRVGASTATTTTSSSSSSSSNVPGAVTTSAGSVDTSLLDNKKGAGEMLGGCSVCLDDEGTEENPLVYCDGCEVAVHRACYGIVSVPPGNWYCRRCEFGDGKTKLKCELCPSYEGALKKTESGQWAHVVCALYIPEVRFGNNNTMEPIEIKHIKADRYTKNCYLCDEKGDSNKASYGAVMDCHKLACKQSFHVTCAQAAGLLCEEAGEAQDNIIYCGYCKHHFRKLKSGNRKYINNSLIHSSSSYTDPASDSSQDNDLRCNISTENDKNSYSTNKLSNLPTNLPAKDASIINPHPLTTARSVTTDNNKLMSNTAPISLTIPLNSANNPNKLPTTQSSTPQKKKKPPNNTVNDFNLAATTNSASTLLTTAGTLANTSVPFSNSKAAVNSSQDVYSWSNMDKEQYGQTPTNNNNINTANNNKISKKKSATSTQGSAAKPYGTSSGPSLTIPSGSQQKQLASPNFSLSSSPSLASPSNSTKSNSSSSTSSISTTSATSSTCSTSSSSPSPALLSPNATNRGLAPKTESPLVSISKPSDTHNKSNLETAQASAALHTGTSNPQPHANLDVLKNDPKKSIASSSLLSTAVPIDNTVNSVSNSLLTTSAGGSRSDISTAKAINEASLSKSGGLASDSAKLGSKTDTQLTVPPLKIPVPQASDATNTTKTTAKTRAAPKNTRKKPVIEIAEGSKPEPKPKASRAKRSAATTDSNSTTSAPKPDAKRRKSKTESDSAPPPPNPTAPAKAATSTPSKRKSRSTSDESTSVVAAAATPASPAKRVRKKKEPISTNPTGQLAISGQNSATSMPYPYFPSTPSVSVGPSPVGNIPPIGSRLHMGANIHETLDMGNRYFSPMISPYANFDHASTPSLSRSSLSRLFTSSSADQINSFGLSDDPAKAFDELREGTWSALSKCVLSQAQQFDIPSLIGTLYALRTENEKLVNKVCDLTMKRDQLIATNARLDLSGPMLAQHLNNTSPNFSSLVSSLANSPKSLPTPSPGSAINKQPLVTVGSYTNLPPGPAIPSGYLDRSSPLISQPHSGLSGIKASTISTPSPPTGAMMAHSSSSRAGLITVNTPYMPNAFPNMNALGPIGGNLTPGSSYYPRQ